MKAVGGSDHGAAPCGQSRVDRWRVSELVTRLPEPCNQVCANAGVGVIPEMPNGERCQNIQKWSELSGDVGVEAPVRLEAFEMRWPEGAVEDDELVETVVDVHAELFDDVIV